jgi:hypothetical protein
MRSTFAAVVAAIVSVSSAQALESSSTARSPLSPVSPAELWKKAGDFCALPSWDPVVENCTLGADGKRRAIKFNQAATEQSRALHRFLQSRIESQ